MGETEHTALPRNALPVRLDTAQGSIWLQRSAN